ncbi:MULTISPECIES: hypothetical protein [Nocardioides]|uniref:Uncharacterized protein n=1 Tax=Nocardioides vastitatis TaxID=2568655 RepID=A0ABW0ZF37_9ACTN|nr:hypothetical protein [Nocardioides sp.]THI96183.1 hypothetical protein E7Z54_17500 [Nocardioides sp.]
MARRNPLGRIKDIAVGSLKAPATMAGSVVGLAKGTVSAGAQVAKTATESVAGAVPYLRGRKVPDPAAADSGGQESSVAPAVEEEPGSSPRTEPVNVTEELGLDPAPVEKPKPAKKAPTKKPMTRIDAAADPSDVDVTPADVAQVVAKKPATRKPAKKSTAQRVPGAEAEPDQG